LRLNNSNKWKTAKQELSPSLFYFSAGLDHDFKNEIGGSGKLSFEASTKRGSSLTGEVKQSMEAATNFVKEKHVEEKINEKTGEKTYEEKSLIDHAEAAGLPDPTSYTKKTIKRELWSGKFEATK
jgi:hypothetical protein